jgi:hypothetical protein
MKKVLTALAAILVSVSAYAQGQVNFRTHIASDTPPIDYKILNQDGTVASGAFAQLVAVNGASITPMTEPAALVNAAGYVSAGAATFAGLLPGTSANLVLRAWQGAAGSSYDSAAVKGQSAQFTVNFAVPPNPPGDLLTLGTGSFTMVPEPTTLALGAIGLGALLIRRRMA